MQRQKEAHGHVSGDRSRNPARRSKNGISAVLASGGTTKVPSTKGQSLDTPSHPSSHPREPPCGYTGRASGNPQPPANGPLTCGNRDHASGVKGIVSRDSCLQAGRLASASVPHRPAAPTPSSVPAAQ